MPNHRNNADGRRMFIDESFFLQCPCCLKDYKFEVASNLKRKCLACKQILPIVNFKYGSETSYRNICNLCKEKQKNLKKYDAKLTYTMMPCGTCLQEGLSIGEATVRVNSKGVWDSEGLHKHQKGIYSKSTKEDFEI